MKKWLIFLSCLLIAAVIAIAAILNNSNSRINTLNQDLYDARTEADTLKKKADEDKNTIEDLNQKIESQNQQIETQNQQIESQEKQIEQLNTDKDALATENVSLNESLENMNRNLSSSQQKLQGMLYILTDGEQGNIEGLFASPVQVYQDISAENPYYEAVNYVTEHQLMIPREEERFGVEEPATLGDLGEGWQALCNVPGTRTEAVAALLKTEKAWLETGTEAEYEMAAFDTPETEDTDEETLTGSAEEDAAEEAEAEPAEEEAAEEAETEPAEEEVAEEAETEPAAEEATEEAEAEPIAEEQQEETAEEETAEDEELVLTRERLLSFCEAICYENGWELDEIVFPESGAEEASRGDLAIALMKLDQIAK